MEGIPSGYLLSENVSALPGPPQHREILLKGIAGEIWCVSKRMALHGNGS